MPQKEPLSPPLLALTGVLAAVPAAWLALAADAVVSGAAGSLAGFHWIALSVTPTYILRAELATEGSPGAALWAFALLAGPLAAALVALGAHLLVESVRSSAWLRILALELLGFAWLRLPALLVAGAFPGGRGPVPDVYARLGEAQAGRWPVAFLAILALAGAGALIAGRTVAVGRTWMRVDGRQFRRRVARVLGGYPIVAALAAWSVLVPWAAPGWMAAWLLLTLSALSVLVS